VRAEGQGLEHGRKGAFAGPCGWAVVLYIGATQQLLRSGGGAYALAAPELRGALPVACSQRCSLPPTPAAVMVGGWGSKWKKKKVCALKT
jgi:hypothetical protein